MDSLHRFADWETENQFQFVNRCTAEATAADFRRPTYLLDTAGYHSI
jgi:hypothetical protein